MIELKHPLDMPGFKAVNTDIAFAWLKAAIACINEGYAFYWIRSRLRSRHTDIKD